MARLIREPIGLRVLIRALRPEDHEPFLLWRADVQDEIDMLIEAGEDEERAALWAGLLRWSEAEVVSRTLGSEGWQVTLHGVRAIALARAVQLLHSPPPGQGWALSAGTLMLRAVPELPAEHEDGLAQLLAFLDVSE